MDFKSSGSGFPYHAIPWGRTAQGGGLTVTECIEGLPLGWFHTRLLLIAGLGGMADGMEISLLLFIGTCAGEMWNLSTREIAMLCSVVFSGEMVGSLFWGPLADHWGRRPVSISGLATISTFGMLSSVAPSFVWLAAFQFFVGVGVGSSAIPFDLFAELLPSPHRGTYLVYLQSFFSIGAALVVCLAWLVLSAWGWRGLVLTTSVPVTVSFVLAYLYLPESPRWLQVQHRSEEAKEFIVEAARVNGSPLGPYFELRGEGSAMSDCSFCSEDEDMGIIQRLCNSDNFWLTIPLWATWFCFGFGYYGIVVLVVRIYSSNSTAGAPVCSFDYGSILVNSASELLTIVILLASIEYGRIRTMSGFFFVAAVSVGCTGVHWFSDSAIFYIVLLARIAGTGSNLATWVATSELFPTDLRATGHAFATAFLRCGSIMAPFLVESTQITLFSVGLILSLVFFCGLGCALMLPETKGMQLDVVS
ncbi:unnamed protein product, partial [Ectocarpus fasciculatus]